MERERRFPASASLGARVTHWWAGLGLTSQFMLASSLVLAACMLFFGYSIANRTSDSVVQHNAAAAALYADSFIETRIQELRLQSRLSEENQRALDELFRPQSAGQPIVAFRIWRGDTVVHSNERELIGKAFPKSALRERAWSGQIVAEYGWAEAADSMSANRSAVRMLEIYAPVHDTGTGRIIALAQTRQIAPMLSAELSRASIESWLLVGFITLHMVALQYLIVRRGSRTIEEQRASLAERISELSRLLAENDQLRQRADRANRRVTEVNERYLRQIGADLHDGPVQLLGMAVLRLDVLQQVVEEGAPAIADEANGEIAVLQDALRDTLVEIRSLSAGLAPPEIESMSLQAILEMIGRRHERRTGMPVVCDVDGLPDEVPLAIKSCFYRFAQEGLNNAFRHAGGRGQSIAARCVRGRIEVEVADSGPGLQPGERTDIFGGQGLVGLRDRIEALGGNFSVGPGPLGGTVLVASIDLRHTALELEPADV